MIHQLPSPQLNTVRSPLSLPSGDSIGARRARPGPGSFDAITRHEIRDRPVLTLGRAAADAARRFGVPHQALPHLSTRGATIDAKAATLATALAPLLTKAAA